MISKSLRFAIFRRDGFRCRYCGARGDETAEGLTVDHVIPTAHGGTDDPTNLVTACHDCNAGKAATTADVPDPDLASLEQARRQVASAQERLELAAEIRRLEGQRWELWAGDVAVLRERWAALFYDHVDPPTEEFLMRHLEAGIAWTKMAAFMDTAFDRAGRGVPGARYFFGCCRNAFAEAEAAG